ncbi:Z1 domain-containing protein [Erysipelothrix sp. D19-032]
MDSYFSEGITIDCEEVWEKESDRFTIGDFKASMPTYTLDPSKTYKKLPFNEIVGEFLEIIHQISPISVDDSAILYHNGVHLCIDNSQNNKINENNEYFRLIYPDNKTLDTLEKAPIFLIVGGSTMSRGLTIEGLITTYFSRNTGVADTLMQMGRWFGYRPRIELFPRIWLTSKGIRQFQFLATLDMDLRNELIEMAKQDIDYSKVGPKLLATPKYTYLTLTLETK